MDDPDVFTFETEIKQYEEREQRNRLFDPVLKARARLDEQKQVVAVGQTELETLANEVDTIKQELKASEHEINELWKDYNRRWIAWIRSDRFKMPKSDVSRALQILQEPFLVTETVQEMRSDPGWQLQIHRELEECFTKKTKAKHNDAHIPVTQDFLTISREGHSFLEEKMKIMKDEDQAGILATKQKLLSKESDLDKKEKAFQELGGTLRQFRRAFDEAQKEWKMALSALSKACTSPSRSLAGQKRKSTAEELPSQQNVKRLKSPLTNEKEDAALSKTISTLIQLNGPLSTIPANKKLSRFKRKIVRLKYRSFYTSRIQNILHGPPTSCPELSRKILAEAHEDLASSANQENLPAETPFRVKYGVEPTVVTNYWKRKGLIDILLWRAEMAQLLKQQNPDLDFKLTDFHADFNKLVIYIHLDEHWDMIPHMMQLYIALKECHAETSREADLARANAIVPLTIKIERRLRFENTSFNNSQSLIDVDRS